MMAREYPESALFEAYAALPSPILLGHRGLNTVATENTLEAIEAAAHQSAAGVEIDVRPTRDGTLVLLHDETLARTSDDPRRLSDLDASALRRVRLRGGERVPTLSDALAAAAARGIFLNIELKRDVPRPLEVVRTLARLLSGRTPEPVIAVSSFDPILLAAFRRLAPDVPTGLLLTPDCTYLELLAAPLRVRAIHPARTLVSAHAVAAWKRRGMRVMTWTVNDPVEAAFQLSIGVDAIMTDDPAQLAAVFSQHRAGSSGSPIR